MMAEVYIKAAKMMHISEQPEQENKNNSRKKTLKYGTLFHIAL